MNNKENLELTMSPCHANRVRICSLNSQKRRALTQCAIDLNIIPTSPQACLSPKVITLQRKKTQQSRNEQNYQMMSNSKKMKMRSVKTQINQKTNQSSSQQFDKLLQITSRCVDYYNKFLEIKGSELKVVTDAFQDIHEGLNKAFNSIITQVNNKHKQIKQFLLKKQKQLIQIKERQQVQLSNSLNDVKSVHLVNLLRDYKSGQQSADLSQQICNYANTLHKFYQSMERVQKQNFKQGVEETINFINNLITQQIKFIIYEKIPSKSLNGSFSFNDGLGFGNSVSSTTENKHQIEHSLVSDSLEHSLSQKVLKKKQHRQGWTQTLNQNLQQKTSLLSALNQITKKQLEMKERIQRYKSQNKL